VAAVEGVTTETEKVFLVMHCACCIVSVYIPACTGCEDATEAFRTLELKLFGPLHAYDPVKVEETLNCSG
jgi:hypothetical protein